VSGQIDAVDAAVTLTTITLGEAVIGHLGDLVSGCGASCETQRRPAVDARLAQATTAGSDGLTPLQDLLAKARRAMPRAPPSRSSPCPGPIRASPPARATG
jgi:hypothetical protein